MTVTTRVLLSVLRWLAGRPSPAVRDRRIRDLELDLGMREPEWRWRFLSPPLTGLLTINEQRGYEMTSENAEALAARWRARVAADPRPIVLP